MPSRQMSKDQLSDRRSDDTRTRLLDAAEDLLRRRGVDGFSYADLSKEVGIRKASIHYHFPTKADILAHLMARYSQVVLASLAEIERRETSPARRLEGFVAYYRLALQGGECLCLCVAMAITQQELSPQTRREIEAYRRAIRCWLRNRFLEMDTRGDGPFSGEPENEADALLALVEGAHISARLSLDMARFDSALVSFLGCLSAHK